MTVTHLSQRDHTQAVIAALEGVGLTVGRGVRNSEPNSQGATLTPPCVIVHPMPGGDRFGTLDDWTKHAELDYQVTCVGRTQAEAEFLRDETEVLLDGLTVTGRHIDVVKREGGSDAAMYEEVPQGEALFMCAPRYRLSSSPA